jgi:NTP pyrophosphatase (non-canonical NTP hydrolase)
MKMTKKISKITEIKNGSILNKIQKELKPWVKHNFGDRPSWMPLLGLIEELGELAHSHLKLAQEIRISEDHISQAKDSVGDIVIYLADYCSSMGFDLESLVQETWNEVKKRDWKKYPANGRTE